MKWDLDLFNCFYDLFVIWRASRNLSSRWQPCFAIDPAVSCPVFLLKELQKGSRILCKVIRCWCLCGNCYKTQESYCMVLTCWLHVFVSIDRSYGMKLCWYCPVALICYFFFTICTPICFQGVMYKDYEFVAYLLELNLLSCILIRWFAITTCYAYVKKR